MKKSKRYNTANHTVFDDVLRTMESRIPSSAVYMINEIFGEKYSEKDGIRFLKNDLTNGSKKRIMDFYAEIQGCHYHGECREEPSVLYTILYVAL